jgi:hypothetical protein
MPTINKLTNSSIRDYFPSKVIPAFAESLTAIEGWFYDDGYGDPWWVGAANTAYRWELEVSVVAVSHGSHLTHTPFFYTGLDIQPGMWVFSVNEAKALRVVSVKHKTENTVTCIVEDADRYNTFKNPAGNGDGGFGTPVDVVFFELGDDGLPIIDPFPSSLTDIAVVSQIEARFRVFNSTVKYRFYQVDHGFEEGNVLTIDPFTRKFTNATATDLYHVGTVIATGPGPNSFFMSPSTKIVSNLEPGLPGQVGDIIWLDGATGELTTNPDGSNMPIYIQLSNPVKSFAIGSVDLPETYAGTSIKLNNTEIEFVGTDPIGLDDIVTQINEKTENHGVTAKVSSPETTYEGTVAFPEATPTSPDFLKFAINGEEITVEPPSINFGDSGQIGFWDIVREINERTHIHGVSAHMDIYSGFITLRQASGETVFIQNISPEVTDGEDKTFTDMIGVPGVIEPTNPTRLGLERFDGGEIIISNKMGDFLGQTGIQGTANGSLPLAIVVDKSMASSRSYVVESEADRDLIPNVRSGDQVFVQTSTDREWALYVRTGNGWTKISDFDSARSDANTMTADITHSSPSSVLVGTISDGCRVMNVTVLVQEPFDGAGASLSVGTDTDQSILISDDILDLSKVGSYESNTSYTYEGVEEGQVVLYLDTQGSTTGKAKIIVSYM